MGLLSALNLRPPRQGADAAAVVDETRRQLMAFVATVKEHMGAGHPQAEGLRKIAIAAGAEAKRGGWDEVRKALEHGKKMLKGDVSEKAKTKSPSEVEPGPAEQSLQEFADDVESTAKRLAQAASLLSSRKDDDGVGKSMADTAAALGKVAEGLKKVGDAAGKLLEVAAVVRKLEQCQTVLARARDVDFANPKRDLVADAEAMGDLARLFGELGAEATKEVPFLKAYFQFIARLGEIWVPYARMVARRLKEAEDSSSAKEGVDARPEPKSPRANTSEIVPLDKLRDFLDRCEATFDSRGRPAEARLAINLREAGRFDELHGKLLLKIEQSQGLKARLEHRLAEATSIELPGEKFLQQDLVRSWRGCHAVATELEAKLGRFAWTGVSYLPAVRSLELARPANA